MDTEPPLQDDRMINENYKQNPYSFWMIIASLVLIIAAFLSGRYWMEEGEIEKRAESGPFFQVTNRQFSIFLWYNPEFMRVNVSTKRAYLTGFQYREKLNIEPGMANQLAVAPPHILFFYHTWARLVGKKIPLRFISASEFQAFLRYSEEWQPKYWEDAPEEYVRLINSLDQQSEADLRDSLPYEVAVAFQGWKCFFEEGTEINRVLPKVGEMRQFLKLHPFYSRNYWKNLVGNEYLKSLNEDDSNSTRSLKTEELTGFLRVAYYNYIKSLATTTKPSS